MKESDSFCFFLVAIRFSIFKPLWGKMGLLLLCITSSNLLCNTCFRQKVCFHQVFNNKLIIWNFVSSLLFIASIIITSYLSFLEKITIPLYISLILFILYLMVLFFCHKKDKSIIIVGASSLTCGTPFLLILNF